MKGNYLKITGARRSGKTYLMTDYIKSYVKNNPGCKILVLGVNWGATNILSEYLIGKLKIATVTKNKIITKNGSELILRPIYDLDKYIKMVNYDLIAMDEEDFLLPKSLIDDIKAYSQTTGCNIISNSSEIKIS